MKSKYGGYFLIKHLRKPLRNIGVVFGAVMTAPSALVFISCFGPSEYQSILKRIDAHLEFDKPDVEQVCKELYSLQTKVVPPMTHTFEIFLSELDFGRIWDSTYIASIRGAIDEELFVIEPWRYYLSYVSHSTVVTLTGVSMTSFCFITHKHRKWKNVNPTYRKISHIGARLRYPLFIANYLKFVSLIANYSEP